MDVGSMTLTLSIAILILFSAYFSGTETAYSTYNRIRMKNLASEGNARAQLVLAQSADFNRLISTILIGNNIVNITSASLATILFTRHFPVNGVTLSTIIMTVLVLIFGEISPKSLAKEAPEKFVLFSAPILRVMMILLFPLNFLFGLWKKLLNRLFVPAQQAGISEEELITIVEEAQNEGGIDEDESQLIRSAIEFNDLEVEEILTPRVDIVAVEETATAKEVMDTFVHSTFSRLPVYRETIDQVVGVIHEKDLLVLVSQGHETISSIISPILFVPPSVQISELFKRLQQAKSHMAVVLDEYGGTMGIVTLEDILEELVGEIWDEHDEVVEYFQQVGERQVKVSCSADLEDFLERFDPEEDADDYDFTTVSGWVSHQLGHIPEAGETFAYKGLAVTVTRTDPRRALEIRVTLPEAEQEQPAPSGH